MTISTLCPPSSPSQDPGPHASGRFAPRLLRMLVVLLLAGFLVAAPSPSAKPAEAAVIGNMLAFGGWHVGAFVSSTGEFVYCLEPGAWEPAGDQLPGEVVDTLPAYESTFPDLTGWNGHVSSGPASGEQVRQINYVLSQYGGTTDPGSAAAVQFAVWLLRDDPGAKAWLDHHTNWVWNNGGGYYLEAAVRLADEARAHATAALRPEPGSLRIERGDGAGRGEHGSYGGMVHYPAGTTELSISGAVFADGRDSVRITGGAAGSVAWQAAPYAGSWAGAHEVSVSGRWRVELAEWPVRVRLFSSVQPGQQRLSAGVGQATAVFTGVLNASESSDTSFTPVLATKVPERFLGAGDRFADTVSIAPAEGTGQWPSRLGVENATEFAPVIAEGTVYGPFAAPQPQSAEVPEGAPVAGRAVLAADAGPGEYQVEADSVVPGAGYYYWVWRIREEDQMDEVRAGGLLPAGYEMIDEFGLVDEGHVVPGALRWTTELLQRELDPARLVLQDRITANPENGPWLQDESGVPIPARIRLTVFQSDAQPVQAAEAPEGATEIARGFVDVTGPGETIQAADIELPEHTRGWVTVQACLIADDQPDEWRGYAEEWCDDYGVPAETARVKTPETLSVTGATEISGLGAAPWLAGGLLVSGVGSLLVGAVVRRNRRSAEGGVE